MKKKAPVKDVHMMIKYLSSINAMIVIKQLLQRLYRKLVMIQLETRHCFEVVGER